MTRPAVVLLLLVAAKLGTGQDCPDVPLLEIPQQYSASVMINLQFGAIAGRSTFIWEAADNDKHRAQVVSVSELNIEHEGETFPKSVEEQILWNPELSGIQDFLYISSSDQDGNTGDFCWADRPLNGTFMDWMFGYQAGHSFPGVLGMLHWADASYTSGCPTHYRGVEVIPYAGEWRIDAWDANLTVVYYWSDPESWEVPAGQGKSVPVAAVLEGLASINGMREVIKMEMDFANFLEVSLPAEFYSPPADLWCEGRAMRDRLPNVPTEISYTSEVAIRWLSGEGREKDVIMSRSEWLDQARLISRTDYKPLDMNNLATDPFDGQNGLVKQINDFTSGLSYTISKDWGNCTIDYLEEDESGTVVIHEGHIHMRNPFLSIQRGDKFAFNGVYPDRGISLDAYLRTAPVFPVPDSTNQTTVMFLSSSDYEVEDGSEAPERLIPSKIISYPTLKYNNPYEKVVMNIFSFSKQAPRFSKYDISACYEDKQKMHLLVRMGWTAEMDIEHTVGKFDDEVREKVVIWGQVTHIRVVNIEYVVDAANSAFYVIFTVLDYPPGMDEMLNELPDAVRPNQEVKANLQAIIDKGWFTLKIYKADHKGTIVSKAEAGSLREMGDRSGNYEHNTGYSPGSMAALGIMMLLLTIGGVLALLVFVLKW